MLSGINGDNGGQFAHSSAGIALFYKRLRMVEAAAIEPAVSQGEPSAPIQVTAFLTCNLLSVSPIMLRAWPAGVTLA